MSRSLSLAACTDLVLNLERSESLMVEDLAHVASMEVEVRVGEVNKGDSSDEENEPGVVSLAWGLKRIVTDLVTVGQIVDPVLFLPGVAACVGWEGVLMAVSKKYKVKRGHVVKEKLTSTKADRSDGDSCWRARVSCWQWGASSRNIAFSCCSWR